MTSESSTIKVLIENKSYTDWPAWSIVGITLVGTVIAYLSYKNSKKATEVSKSMVEIENRRDFQPSLISAWLEPSAEIAFNGNLFAVSMVIKIQNNSNELFSNLVMSIYRLRKNDGSDAEAVGTEAISYVPPLQTITLPIRQDILIHIDNGRGLVSNRYTSQDIAIREAFKLSNSAQILLDFNDKDGKRWTKDLNGKITSK